MSRLVSKQAPFWCDLLRAKQHRVAIKTTTTNAQCIFRKYRKRLNVLLNRDVKHEFFAERCGRRRSKNKLFNVHICATHTALYAPFSRSGPEVVHTDKPNENIVIYASNRQKYWCCAPKEYFYALSAYQIGKCCKCAK